MKMYKLLLYTGSLALIFTAAYLSRNTSLFIRQWNDASDNSAVLSEKDETLIDEVHVDSDASSHVETATEVNINNDSTAISLPQERSPASGDAITYDRYIYPNHTELSQTDGVIDFVSSDSPELITDWYEQKIREGGMNVKTSVRTSSNDNIINKLAGANSVISFVVEITLKPGDTITHVMMEFGN